MDRLIEAASDQAEFSKAVNSILKTLDLLRVSRHGERVVVGARARSFLHHQVRNMVGTLKLVGEGKWSPDAVTAALQARDRAAAGQRRHRAATGQGGRPRGRTECDADHRTNHGKEGHERQQADERPPHHVAH